VKKQKSDRLWEIDSLRGIAIILMVAYHFVFDLNFYRLYSTDIYSLSAHLIVYPVGSLFLLLVGISLTLSYSRVEPDLTKNQLRMKFLKRGAGIFGLGLLITLVTWVYPHDGFIVFGVLHCIGLSILLAYPLIRYRIPALVLGIVLIVVGVVLQVMVTVGFPWLVWLGVVPTSFSTLDYYPLLPWFGMVLIGVFIGNSVYKNSTRCFQLKDHSQSIAVRILSFLGRYSLIIYLAHQLIIVGLLYLIFRPVL
jgi:uncharacterized membrane protein